MDPLSITLGVAPLCVVAFKGSRRLREKIKLIRDHEGEVRRLRTKLKTQISVFRDELQLLLQAAGVESSIAAAMLRDYSHEQWTAKSTERCIENHLDQKYCDIREASERIGDQIGKIEEHLGRLGGEEEGRGTVSRHFTTSIRFQEKLTSES